MSEIDIIGLPKHPLYASLGFLEWDGIQALRDQSSSDRNKRLDGVNSDEQNVQGWELDHFEIHVKVKAIHNQTLICKSYSAVLFFLAPKCKGDLMLFWALLVCLFVG